MVKRSHSLTPILWALAPCAALAQSPQDKMFPDARTCYARAYSASHLASHPEQRVTRISVTPDFALADPQLVLHVVLELRGPQGGIFEAYGYCDNEGGDTLYCGLEGDAGAFQVTTAEKGAVLLEVGQLGMSLENGEAFATLESASGDDRSFLLKPVACP